MIPWTNVTIHSTVDWRTIKQIRDLSTLYQRELQYTILSMTDCSRTEVGRKREKYYNERLGGNPCETNISPERHNYLSTKNHVVRVYVGSSRAKTCFA